MRHALRATADEAEAFYSDQTTSAVEIVNGQLESVVSAAGRGVGLRALVGQRVGYAYSSDVSPEGRVELVEHAVRLAREATPDSHAGLPQAQPLDEKELGIFDSALSAYPLEWKVDLLRRLETAARQADTRVHSTDLARYSDSIRTNAVVNSRGISTSYQATSCYATLVVIARHDGEAQRGHAVTAGRGPTELEAEETGRRAARRATAALGGTIMPTQRASVVMEPEVAAELLRGLTQALSAEAVLKGRSFLVGREGQRVSSPLITLVDDGSLPRAYATAPVDGEGVPTQRTELLQGGVLGGLLHSAYTARRAGASPTGNGLRPTHRVLPEVGPSNLLLEPGPLSADGLIAGVESGLLVVTTRNVGGINPVSGDYSVGASGRWIERGEVAGPVSGVTIAAPMLEMLANLSAIASDVRWIPGLGAVAAPSVRIDDVTIGGR